MALNNYGKHVILNKPQVRRCSIFEGVKRLFIAAWALPLLKSSDPAKKLDSEFREELALAVTQVNQCKMCSYAHSKMALEAGMSQPEIENLLNGELGNISSDHLPAILFAQSYAQTQGKDQNKTFLRIQELYGKKAKAIKAIIQVMMAANAYGIVFGDLRQRFKGIPAQGSNIFYELGMLLIMILLIPILLVVLLIALIFNR